jgi:hypothetical protein
MSFDHDGWSAADEARADALWEQRQEYAEDLADERAQRQAQRCQCHDEGWPGSCPGPANCPCCNHDDEEAA